MSLVNKRFMLKGQLEAVEKEIKESAWKAGSMAERFIVNPFGSDPTKVVFTTTSKEHGGGNSIILNATQAAELIDILKHVFGLGPVEDIDDREV